MPILFWGHGALSLLVLAGRFLPDRFRDPFVRIVCGIGAGLGVALFLDRRSGDAWRTTVVDPQGAAIAGVAIAVAWVTAAVLMDEEDRWRAAALVGPGAGALALLAGTRWTVTALLFWAATSIVAAALAWGSHRRTEIWLGIVLSDLCLVAGLVGHIVDTDGWQLPNPAPDRAFWFLLAAVVLRVGVIPRFGLWRALGSPGLPALPLLLGSGFVVAHSVMGRAAPWAAVGLLCVALAQAIWGSTRSGFAGSDFAGWPSSTCLALVLAAPETAALASVAGLLAACALGVWPLVRGSAQAERGLLLTLAPLTAAFGAVVFVARTAFDLSTGDEPVGARIPWIVLTALLPLVIAAGVLLGARVGRERQEGAFDPWPLAATWLFVAASAVVGMLPGSLELPDDVIGSDSTLMTLLLIAIGAGALSGWLWSLRHPDHRRSPRPEPLNEITSPPMSAEVAAYRATAGKPTLVARIVLLMAAALALVVVGAIGWATFEGLTQGFL